MRIIRHLIFANLIILLGWLFVINSYEIDIFPIQNKAYKREQISEIEDSNSIAELKTIAKSKVFIINRIHKLNDEKSTKELYLILVIISMSIFLYFTQKPAKTHNS